MTDALNDEEPQDPGTELAFRVVRPEVVGVVGDEEDLDGEPGEEPAEFVCEVCSDFFGSQRGLNVHLGQKHPERKDLQKSVGNGRRYQRKPRSGSVEDANDFTGGTFGRTASRGARPVRRFILAEVNSYIVTGVSLMGVPDYLIDAPVIPWGVQPGTGKPEYKSIQEIVTFSPREATILAEGVSRMEKTPAAVRVGKTVGPAVPYFFGLLALVVVAKHVVDLFTLRAKLAALQAQLPTDQGQNADAPASRPQFI